MPSVNVTRPPSTGRWLLVLAILVAAAWWFLVPRPPSTDEAAPVPSSASVAPAEQPVEEEAQRRDLSRDESRGGHTLERHVGLSDDDLASRLEREKGISAASTYTDRALAERTVARTLSRSRARVEAWVDRGNRRPNLALSYRGTPGDVLGRTLLRGHDSAEPATDAVVVLRADGPNFFVLTSYPEKRR